MADQLLARTAGPGPGWRTRVRSRLVDSPTSLGASARQRRWELFTDLFPDVARLRVVDLGGTVEAWRRAPVRPREVVVVNLYEPGDPADPTLVPVTGDACRARAVLAEAGVGGAFDLVFSNSLLEHVGGHAQRRALAEEVRALIAAAGLPAATDGERGFDHGTFSPMAVAWPKADLPLVQLSLRIGLDPAEHLALGRVLAPLRERGILIVGSGLSYHNLRNFGPGARGSSARFDGWLDDAMSRTGSARSSALIDWEQAPSAREAHPREEHLLPLMVAVGAAEGDTATRVYHQSDFFGGISVSNFRFGARVTSTPSV